MSAIDKTYAKWEQYCELKKWAKDSGYPGSIVEWSREDFEKSRNGILPVMYSTIEDDLFLIKHCPLTFVRDMLELAYDEDYIREVLSLN